MTANRGVINDDFVNQMGHQDLHFLKIILKLTNLMLTDVKYILTNRNNNALRWVDELFYYSQQTRNIIKFFTHLIFDCGV